MLTRYDYLSEQHKKECEDHDRERELNRAYQREKKQYEGHLQMLTRFMERDPFVVVLIDGDGMIFQDDFLKAGEFGGKKAAAQLQNLVSDYIHQRMDNIPISAKVVTRVYANVKGLSDICVRTGIVDEASQVEEFVRGFTRGRTLFDFVDVGPGKDRADEKLIETFKLYLSDFHCRQIFFGCSHDNGYARILDEVTTEGPLYISRITLLEGVPFEKELAILPFNTHKFPLIFRDTKINVFGTNSLNNGIGSIGPLTGYAPPSRAAQSIKGPTTIGAGLLQARTPSSSTITSNDAFPSLLPPTTTTWASKAAAPPPTPPTPPPTTHRGTTPHPDSAIASLPRNRYGQRVDPPARNYDKDEVNRVKNLKMCNVHFLRQECPFGDACTHIHGYKPTAAELATLRLVARMAPCQNGSECVDLKCIYGHRCPAPEAKTGGKGGGGRNCIFGDKCKFPEELHGLDTVVVKCLVIR